SGSFFFASRRRHTSFSRDWSSDVCSSDLMNLGQPPAPARFSITSGWPRFILGASIRMIKSGGPPGGEGTTTRIGFAGQACASARSEERRVGKEGAAGRSGEPEHHMGGDTS